MPRGGHNKKPTPLHVVQGTFRKGRHKTGEPIPRPGRVTCPGWLDPEAKRLWRRLAPELRRLGLLTTLDRGAFAAYCQAYARCRQATETLRREGEVISDGRGGLKKHPMATIAKQAQDTMRAFAQEFGLTPQSRSRLRVPEPPADDPLGEFLNRGGGDDAHEG